MADNAPRDSVAHSAQPSLFTPNPFTPQHPERTRRWRDAQVRQRLRGENLIGDQLSLLDPDADVIDIDMSHVHIEGEVWVDSTGIYKVVDDPAPTPMRLTALLAKALPQDVADMHLEDFRAELYDLAQTGASRRAQLVAVLRMAGGLWTLRREARRGAEQRGWA